MGAVEEKGEASAAEEELNLPSEAEPDHRTGEGRGVLRRRWDWGGPLPPPPRPHLVPPFCFLQAPP